jgi:hypothetical protein
VRDVYTGVIRHSSPKADTEFTYEIADSFWRRLLGLRVPIKASALVFPKCSGVHGFGMRQALQVVLLSDSGRVLQVRNNFGAWSVCASAQARHVVEFVIPQNVTPGDQLLLKPRLSHKMPKGFSVLEALLALPILIFVLFVVIQIGLLWHAKFALQNAVVVAARHASVSHGSDAAIRDALVQGLAPLFSRSVSVSDLPTALFRSGAELSQGLAFGWLRWEVLSPTRQSFQDWAKPADRYLSPTAGAGELEIPSAPLPALATRAIPLSGVARRVGGLPVGLASGQTLLEANTLKLKLQFGVPLSMPIAGQLLAKALSLWSGCGWPNTAAQTRIGLVNYGVGATPSLVSSNIECRALAARDLQGRWKPRWPIQVFAVVSMQSHARRSVMVLRDRDAAEEPSKK